MGFLARPHGQVTETLRGSTRQGVFLAEGLEENDRIINEKIEEIAKKRGVSMAVVAVAWSLSKWFMTSPILGMSKKERVDEAIAAVNFDLTEEEIESIDSLYAPKKLKAMYVESKKRA